MNELRYITRENKNMPYYNWTKEDLAVIEDFARKYSYYYLHGNDTLNSLGNTVLFRDIKRVFDKKAYLHWSNDTTHLLSKRKYSYKSAKPETLATILRGLDVIY